MPVESTDAAQLCAAHYRPLHAHVRRKLIQHSFASGADAVTGPLLAADVADPSGVVSDE